MSNITYTFTIKVTDANGVQAAITDSIHVGPAILNLSGDAPNATQNQTYAYSYTLTGAAPPVTYSVSSGSLPTGLSLNADTGAITGIPTVVGPYNFTIRVVDSLDAVDTVTDSITVASAASVTLAGPAPDGRVGSAYQHQYTASGGTGGYTYSIVSGSLPAGITLNTSTGALSGTPTAAGTATYTVRATSGALTADLAESVVIAEEQTGWILHVAQGTAGLIIRSPDGRDWEYAATQYDTGAFNMADYVANGVNIFGVDPVLRRSRISTNGGQNWTSSASPAVGLTIGTAGGKAAWHNGFWFVCGGDALMNRSADGITFVNPSQSQNSRAIGVVSTGTRLITVNSQSRVTYYSDDNGTTWLSGGSLLFVPGGTAGGITGAVGAHSGATTLFSTLRVRRSGELQWGGEPLSDDTFATPYIHRSTDGGLTWSNTALQSLDAEVTSIVKAGSAWVVTTAIGEVFRSTDDGVTWSTVTVSFAGRAVTDAFFANGLLVVVGMDGLIATSEDEGQTFTVRSYEPNGLQIGFGQPVFATVAATGRVSQGGGGTGVVIKPINPGFESGLTGWTAFSTGTHQSYDWIARSGRNSGVWTGETAGGEFIFSENSRLLRIDKTAYNGQTLNATMWVACSFQSAQARIGIQIRTYHDAARTQLASVALTNVKTYTAENRDWQQVSSSLTIGPSVGEYVTVAVAVAGVRDTNVGILPILHFDDVDWNFDQFVLP